MKTGLCTLLIAAVTLTIIGPATAQPKPVKALPLTLERDAHRLPNLNWLAFSPDGKWLACVGADRVVRVWDMDALLPK